MAKLFVPACGDRLMLAKPWQFDLFLESRNIRFAQERGLVPPTQNWTVWQPGQQYQKIATTGMSLDAGTVLECDRVYIRATSKSADAVEDSYDSITWKVVVNGKPVRNQRFWVKLSDCYNLEFDPKSISRYMDRK